MKFDKQTAKSQGYKAFLDDRSIWMNPYRPDLDSEAHKAWSDGWKEAKLKKDNYK